MISIIVIVLVAGTLYYLVKTANDFYQKEEELEDIVRKRYVGEGVERKEDKKRELDDDIIPISAGYVLGSLTSPQTNPFNSSSIFKEVTESIVDSIISDSGSSAGGGSTSSWSDSSSDSGSDSGGSSGD